MSKHMNCPRSSMRLMMVVWHRVGSDTLRLVGIWGWLVLLCSVPGYAVSEAEIGVRIVTTLGQPLAVPYQVRGNEVSISNSHVSGDRQCALVSTRTAEGEVAAPTRVIFSSPGSVLFVFNCNVSNIQSPQTAIMNITRSQSHSTLIPGEALTVRYDLRNNGTITSPFSLSTLFPLGSNLDISSDAQQQGTALVWQDQLDAQQSRAYTLAVTPSCQTPTQVKWQSVFEAQKTSRDTRSRLFQNTLSLLVIPTGLELVSEQVNAEREVHLSLSLTNPLERSVTFPVTLEADGPLDVTSDHSTPITLAAGESIVVPIRVRPARAGRYTLRAGPNYHGVGLCQPATLELPVNPRIELPKARLTRTYAYDVSVQQVRYPEGMVMLATLPPEMRYEGGSAKLNSRPIADPLVFGRTLVFKILDKTQAIVSFDVEQAQAEFKDPETALIVLLPEPQVLSGNAEVALEAFTRAKPYVDELPTRTREGSLIMSPYSGHVERGDSEITVTVDVPLLNKNVRLSVNGQVLPDASLGEETRYEAIGRRSLNYIAVTLRPGPNSLYVESEDAQGKITTDRATVFLVGKPDRILITPHGELVADSATPLQFDVTVTDAWGNIPRDSSLTFEVTGGEFSGADSEPNQLGFQLDYTDGRTLLELKPLAYPKRVTVNVHAGNTVGGVDHDYEFLVGTSYREWIGAGIISAGATYNPYSEGTNQPSFAFGVAGGGFARGSVTDTMQLTVAAHYPLTPLGIYGDPYERFKVLGSSEEVTHDIQSRHGIYARLESNLSHVQYGDFTPEFEDTRYGLSIDATGLSGTLRHPDRPLWLRAYIANSLISNQREEELLGDGTSLYRINAFPIEPGSVILEVIKRDVTNNQLIRDSRDTLLATLEQGKTFVIDEDTGYIRLSRPLPQQDGGGNRYALKIGYRVVSSTDNLEEGTRAWRYGMQLGYDYIPRKEHLLAQLGVDEFKARVHYYGEPRDARGLVQLLSANASAKFGDLLVRVEGALGEDLDNRGLAANAQVTYNRDGVKLALDAQVQGEGFRSVDVPDDGHAGYTLEGEADIALGEGVSLDASLSVTNTQSTQATKLEAALESRLPSPGNVATNVIGSLGASYQDGDLRLLAGIEGRDLFGIPYTSLAITHRQSFQASTSSTTTFTLGYEVLQNIELALIDTVTWGEKNELSLGFKTRYEDALFDAVDLSSEATYSLSGEARASVNAAFRHAELFGVAADWGSTQITANYAIPGGVSPLAGEASLGIDTSYPISDALSLDAGFEQTLNLNPNSSSETSTVITTGLRYDTDNADATFRYELRLAQTNKHVFTLATQAKLWQALFVGLDSTYLIDDSQTPNSGYKVTLASAYRGTHVTIITQQELRGGAFSHNTAAPETFEITGDTRLTYEFMPDIHLQLGYVYRYQESSGFQDMISLGVGWSPLPQTAFTLLGRYYHDWYQSQGALGFTIEISQELMCGLYGVVGYSWSDLANTTFAEPRYNLEGFQLRLEFVFDEQWHCLAR